jgi:hypothetical protein
MSFTKETPNIKELRKLSYNSLLLMAPAILNEDKDFHISSLHLIAKML